MYFRVKPGRKKVIVIGFIVAALLLAGGFFAYTCFGAKEPEAAANLKTDAYKLRLRIEEECLYEYADGYLETKEEAQIILSVPQGENISFTIKSSVEKELDTVRIVSEDKQEIDYIKNGNQVTITMNYGDVTVTPIFKDTSSSQTDAKTIQTASSKYDLKLEGYDEEIEASYNSLFHEIEFINALGKTLDLDHENSKYKDIKTVTFIKEAYETDNSDIVGHFIIFNNDTERKALVLFSKENKAYTFNLNYTNPTPAPSPTPVPTQEPDQAANTTPTPEQSASNENANSQEPAENSSATPTQETSFDILEVSTRFIDYVGNKDDFYNNVYAYVKSLGYNNGSGTFQGYTIDQSNDQVSFEILLDNGTVVNGVYSKANNSYSF